MTKVSAGQFEHIDGTLIDHLKGTKELLEEWDAPEDLQDAGLYHAAYGTVWFTQNFVPIEQRPDIAAVIGEAAEETVYHCCACVRRDFFVRIGKEPR